MKILIFGIGGIGGFAGGALAGTGSDVYFYVRGKNREAIEKEGLHVTSELLGDFTVHPKGMGQDGKALGKMDVILLACKGNGLAKACHDMAPMVATHTVVVPLLNGVLVSDLMEPLLPPCFIADGTIRVFSHLEKPGHVVQTAGSGQVVMGMKDGRDLPLLHELAALLQKSGIPAKVTHDIRLDSWEKYALMAANSALFCLFDGPAGKVRRQKNYRQVVAETVGEVIAMAKVQGVIIPPAYKEDYPDSYPLTTIYDVGFLERMTMPSWGLSLGTYNSTSSQVLSWDYENRAYFAGAISRQYRDYITFLHRLYAEGLLDPEMTQDDASTTLKLATGASMAVYAFYDQIGGWEQASEIEGLRLALYPPLTGPSGAHHMPKARLMNGIIFPVKTTQREDFEQVVRKIDEILFSEDAYMVWSLGLEGKTYTMDGDQVVFSDDILNAPEGIAKYMQNAYGCGCGGTQCVFRSALEMFKNKSDFAAVNTEVAAMDQAMQYVPAAPAFDDLTAEDATLLQGALGDAYAVWNDAFIRGTRDIDADWDTYVQEMKDKGMDEYLALFNQFSRYQ